MVVKRNNYPNILPNTSMYWNNNKKQLEHQVLNPHVSKSSKYFRHVVSLNPYVHVPTSCHIAHEPNSILNSSKRPRLCEISGFVFFQKLCSFLSLSICLTLNNILIFIEVPSHTQTHTYTHTHTASCLWIKLSSHPNSLDLGLHRIKPVMFLWISTWTLSL